MACLAPALLHLPWPLGELSPTHFALSAFMRAFMCSTSLRWILTSCWLNDVRIDRGLCHPPPQASHVHESCCHRRETRTCSCAVILRMLAENPFVSARQPAFMSLTMSGAGRISPCAVAHAAIQGHNTLSTPNVKQSAD
jgi:hypothetical protein